MHVLLKNFLEPSLILQKEQHSWQGNSGLASCVWLSGLPRELEAPEEVKDRLCVPAKGQVPGEEELPDDSADEEIPQNEGGSEYRGNSCQRYPYRTSLSLTLRAEYSKQLQQQEMVKRDNMRVDN